MFKKLDSRLYRLADSNAFMISRCLKLVYILNSVAWIGAEGSYVCFHMAHGRSVLMSGSLHSVLSQLYEGGIDYFVRIHHSHAVNLYQARNMHLFHPSGHLSQPPEKADSFHAPSHCQIHQKGCPQGGIPFCQRATRRQNIEGQGCP